MVTLSDIQGQSREHIFRQAEEVGIVDIRVFGSVARGEAGLHSDLDLLVSVKKGVGLLALARFERTVAEAVGCRVQVVTEKSLHPLIKDRVLQEAVWL